MQLIAPIARCRSNEFARQPSFFFNAFSSCVTKQLVSAVIVAALLIGSTQMIIHNIHPLWGQNSSIGIVGMILAGIIGLSMLKDLRRGDHDDWNGWKDN